MKPTLDLSDPTPYEFPYPQELEELEKLIIQRIAQAKYDIIYDVRKEINNIPNLPTLLEHIKKFGILISQIDNRNETQIESIKNNIHHTLHDFDKRIQDCIDKTQMDINTLIDRHRRERQRMNERMASLINEITLLKKQMNRRPHDDIVDPDYNNIKSLLERDAVEKNHITEQIGSITDQINYLNDNVDKLKLDSKCPLTQRTIDYVKEQYDYKLDALRNDIYEIKQQLKF
jgi:ElaB/YqjD/DUF883 family membrane-anchored ribosome-binding protein